MDSQREVERPVVVAGVTCPTQPVVAEAAIAAGNPTFEPMMRASRSGTAVAMAKEIGRASCRERV